VTMPVKASMLAASAGIVAPILITVAKISSANLVRELLFGLLQALRGPFDTLRASTPRAHDEPQQEPDDEQRNCSRDDLSSYSVSPSGSPATPVGRWVTPGRDSQTRTWAQLVAKSSRFN